MNDEIIEIPELSVNILTEFKKLEYDPKAINFYEWLSGGLVWRDEYTNGLMSLLLKEQHPITQYLFRYLWAYRSSVICGEERLEYRNIWQSVYKQVPSWPGFRPERSDSSHLQKLLEGQKQMEQELDNLDCL